MYDQSVDQIFLSRGNNLSGTITEIDSEALVIATNSQNPIDSKGYETSELIVFSHNVLSIVSTEKHSFNSMERTIVNNRLNEFKESGEVILIWLVTGICLKECRILDFTDDGLVLSSGENGIYVRRSFISSLAGTGNCESGSFGEFPYENFFERFLFCAAAEYPNMALEHELYLENGVKIMGDICGVDDSTVYVVDKKRAKSVVTSVNRSGISSVVVKKLAMKS